MKKVGIAVISMIAAVLVQGTCWADPGTTPTVRIRLQGNGQYSPGRNMTFTIECPCGHACGSDLERDNVFLRRLSQGWGEMGKWYVLGTLPYNTATKTFTVNIFAGQQQADDYVLTTWWGNNSCWGQSQRFTISAPGSRQGDPDVLVFPHDGKTLYRGNQVGIAWRRDPGWNRVKIELLKRERVVSTVSRDTGADIRWTIALPESAADGNDFRMRLTSIETGKRDESGVFTIKTPRLEIVDPVAGSRFNRGDRMTVCWQSQGMPSDATFAIGLHFDLPRSCFQLSQPVRAYYPQFGGPNATGPCYSWVIPPATADGSTRWPKAACFPFNGYIEVSQSYSSWVTHSGAISIR